MDEIDFVDILNFIKTADQQETSEIITQASKRSMELTKGRKFVVQLKNARTDLRSNITRDFAEERYGEKIILQLEKEGFFFMQGNKIILSREDEEE